MSSRSAIQAHLSELFKQAKLQGYQAEDVMPQEIKEHFTEMIALAEAKTFIKELEDREKALEMKNADLIKALQAKQAEIDSIPGDTAAMRIDLDQSRKAIDYYKNLTEGSEKRAAHYQEKLRVAEQMVAAMNNQTRTIERLQAELRDREKSNMELSQESSAMADRYEALLIPYRKTIKEKECEIRNLKEHTNELTAEKVQSAQLSQAYDTLIDTLEQETNATMNAVNEKSMYIQATEAFYSAITSEIEPLKRFNDHVCEVIELYYTAIQNLSGSTGSRATILANDIQKSLDLASEEMEKICHVSDLTSTRAPIGDAVQHTIRTQINNMAESSGHMHLGLDSLGHVVTQLLRQSEDTNTAWWQLRSRFGGSSRPASIVASPVAESAKTRSRRSSVSSSRSWSTHFSLCN